MDKRLFFILLSIGLCLGLLNFELPQAKAVTVEETLIFTSLSYDGRIDRLSTSYSVSRNSTSGLEINDAGVGMAIGQFYEAGFYRVPRDFVFFQTSVIPALANITSAKLRLCVKSFAPLKNFTMVLQNGQPTYPHMPLELGDFNMNWYSGDGGSFNTSDITGGQGTYFNITLNTNGISWINRDDVTKLCIRSLDDINNVPPTQREYIDAYTSEQGDAYAPKLYVTYEYETQQYVFHGLYNEVGTFQTTGVNVTANFVGEVPKQTFFVNGSYVYNTTITPYYFEYDLGEKKRQYWLAPTETGGAFYIYNDTLTTYIVSFIDLSGVLTENPYVEAKRWISGFLRTVEKRKIDKENKVIFNLVQNTRYTITIGDGQSHTFGDVEFTAIQALTLTLKGIDFPKETLLTQKYVRIYGLRSFGNSTGNITVTFQDTQNKTNNVTILIKYRNGTTAYTATLSTNQFVFEWQNAQNTLDYTLTATINHQQYGSYDWRQYFPRTFSEPPWSLDWLGSLGFNTSIIIPALLIIFVGSCFSVLNVTAGAFATVAVAVILAWIGWIAIPPAFLLTALMLAIILALIIGKSRSISE